MAARRDCAGVAPDPLRLLPSAASGRRFPPGPEGAQAAGRHPVAGLAVRPLLQACAGRTGESRRCPAAVYWNCAPSGN